MHIEIRVTSDDFDIGAEWQAQRTRVGGAAGAVTTFVGLVRDRHANDPVQVLELEHYPGMTESSIERIVREAETRWPLLDVVVVHRVGRMLAGDQIVLVQVASAHRPAAFAACEFLMDYLKTDAVFWKREERDSGVHWIESTSDDVERRKGWSS
jgi:molybdopterin synthase catalytic subunit